MKTVTLARMPRGWYVPANPESYSIIKELGAPMLLVPDSYLSLLKATLARKKIAYAEVDFFKTILEPKITAIGTSWQSKKGRKCRSTLQYNKQSHMVFSAPQNEASRKLIAKIEANLAAFFLRWGIKHYSDFDDKGAGYKLSVTFQFTGTVSPMMPTLMDEPRKTYETQLGFTKMRFTFYEKNTDETRRLNVIAPSVLLEVFSQAGNDWLLCHTATFKPKQIGDLRDMYATIEMLSAKRKVETD